MNLKRIIGSHFANYKEAWEANRLIDKGLIHPTLSKVYPMNEVGQAAYDVHRNAHQGKVGVLTLAPERRPRRPRPRQTRQAPRRHQPLPRGSERWRTVRREPQVPAVLHVVEDGPADAPVLVLGPSLGTDLGLFDAQAQGAGRPLPRDPLRPARARRLARRARPVQAWPTSPTTSGGSSTGSGSTGSPTPGSPSAGRSGCSWP